MGAYFFKEVIKKHETSKISGTRTTEVRIKFYSKSADYSNYCINTLRIEDKLTTVRGANKIEIVYVSDLYKIESHISLLEKHLENISKIVLFDYNIKVPKNSKYLKKIREFSNPNYWIKLIKACKKRDVYETKYNDEVSLLNSLSKKYGTNMLENLIEQTKKQSLIALDLCNFSELKAQKNQRMHNYV